MELGQNLWYRIHILEDAPVYSQFLFHALIHRVNGMHHTLSIQIEDFIDSLDSFLWKYSPQRTYSMVLGTARPTIMMKAFVAPPILPPIFVWIGLVQIPLVGLD